MNEQFSFDVFLSYNSNDKTRVRRLAERLREAGLRVWFDEWVIKPEDDNIVDIEHGLKAARALILCLSPTVLEAEWKGTERSTLLFREPSNTGRRFIPLLLADCDLPDTLKQCKYVDFRQESDTAFAELLAACRYKMDSPPPESTFITKRNLPGKKKKHVKQSEPSEPLETPIIPEHKLSGHTGWVGCIAISPDGKWAASGSEDKTIKIWDLETGSCRVTLTGHTKGVKSVAILKDGKQLLSGSKDNTICLSEIADGRLLDRFEASKHFVLSVAAMSDGKRALSGGAGGDPILKIWDLATRTDLTMLIGHTGPVNSVALSKNENWVVSGSGDKTIRIWDLKGKCLASLKGHTDAVNSVRLMPDERYAASGSDDKTVKVWDLDTGVCIKVLGGHHGKVHSIAVSPDGSMIASTGFTDKTIRLWDWKSRTCLKVIKNGEDFLPMSVAITPDGSRLVVGTADSSIYVYRLTGAIRSLNKVEMD